jgi:molybdenum cofactor synthesis domain-containing protein
MVERDQNGPSPKVRPEHGAPPVVELILVGDDLLRGDVTEGNTRFLAARIAERGGVIRRSSTVADDEASIVAALTEALARNPHLVILTGGLGPAADDRTLTAVAGVLRRPLTMSPQARSLVEQAYQRLVESKTIKKAGLNLVREKMCKIPLGSIALENSVGVAPGVVYRLPGGSAVVCLPGKPEEARAVFEEALPLLKDLAPRLAVARREIEAPSADESSVRPLIDRLAEEFPRVRITSRPVGSARKGAKVLVTIEASAPSSEAAEAAVGATVRRLLGLASGGC